MNSTIKTVLFWAVIVISAFLLWQVVKTGTNAQKEKEIGFSEFLAYVDQGNIQDVTFTGQEAKGKIKSPDSLFHTTVPANYPDMYKKLTEKNVPYSFKGHQQWHLAELAVPVASARLVGSAVVLHDSPDADWRKQGALIRQEPGAPALHAAEKDHVQRRGGRGRGQRRA